MQKANFTLIRGLQCILLSALMLFGFSATAQTLACNDAVQISVDDTPNVCQATLTADMFLEGTPDPTVTYYIRITDGLQVVVPTTPGSTATALPVTVQDLDQYFDDVLTVKIYAGDPDGAGGASVNSCWSEMTVEDKLAPIVNCADVTIACTADADLVAPAAGTDNCGGVVDVQLVDEVVNTSNNCNATPAAGFTPYSVTIARTYVSIDEQGNTSQPCTQVITVIRPDFVDIPDDLVWSCEQYDAYPYIIDAARIMPGIANQFGGAIQPFDNTNAWDLTTIALTDARLTNNVPGTDPARPTGSGVPSGVFPLANGNANPIGGDLGEEYCKFAYSSADQVLSTCGFAASTDSPVFKIVRTWTVLDWCTGNVVSPTSTPVPTNPGEDAVQVIKVIDNVEPTVTIADVTISANIQGQHPQPCKGQGPIPLGTATDNCTGVDVATLQGFVYSDITLNSAVAEVQIINGIGILNPPLPIGTYYYQWDVTDNCGNVGLSGGALLEIVDDIVPTPICDEITTVSLSSDGFATVYAETFDDGSYDNCCLDRLEVRRMSDNCAIPGNTVFGESVTFCCADIANAPIMVAMQAVDCAGNTNQCMVEVLVEDKIAPVIVCPENDKISCDEYADVLESALLACDGDDECESTALTAAGFGTFNAFDNCEANVTPTVSISINQCGVGSVVRSFSAVDPSGNGPATCTQVITVYHVSDFVVEFPADVDGLCDQATPSFGEPEIFFETCELVATSFEDQVFDVVPDACFKVVRQWTVINWCVVGDNIDQENDEDPENALGLGFPACDLDGDGDCDDRTFRDSWENGIYPGRLASDFPAVSCDNVGNDTDNDVDGWDGFITYQQSIKVQDFDAPVIDPTFDLEDLCIITGNDGTDDDFSDCVFNGVLPTPEYDDCIIDVNGENEDGELIENDVIITTEVFDADGNLVSNSTVLTDLPIGCYVARYTAVDRCGNATATDFDFCIEDCKFPTPYCKDGLVVELMHINDPNNTSFEPMVEVWAVDLDAGSFDNCPGAVKLSFSPNVNEVGVTFNCDNVGENTVELWVTDASGNQDFCETFIVVQANQGQCPGNDPLVAVGGAIANETNDSVEEVMVEVSGQSTGSMMTAADGNFSFNIPTGNDVTVTPSKDDNHDNGVTTFDLVVISKHILGTQVLDSPYKMIAADANNSGNISTLDLVHIRKVILQIEDEFTANTSWRFVDADFDFPNANNPWETTFPEVVNINNVDAATLDADFVAVKIGDVNGSAATQNNLLGADDRSAGTLNIATADRLVKAGETVTVDFTTVEAVQGYQFTLNFNNALTFAGLNAGTATEENFGFTKLEEGAITASYNGETADEDAAFSMTFTANADIMLSEALSINSRFTAAEAYNTNNDLLDVALNFNNEAVATFELYQNTPNPFAGETTIGFNMAEAGAATLTITDMSGRVLATVNGEYAAGYNSEIINNLPATGVLYYTLETANETATKKMVATK